MTIGYGFDTPGTCLAGGSHSWFNLHDDIANLDLAGANKSANSTTYACNASALPAFPLPAGNYTLDFMEEVYVSSGFNVWVPRRRARLGA